MNEPQTQFTRDVLDQLFPPERSNAFFEALFGDAAEGAYDIRLGYQGYDAATGQLRFALELHQRPGHCLACNLTSGLPAVFARHPIINIEGLVEAICARLGEQVQAVDWELGYTDQIRDDLHAIPLVINLQTDPTR